jgi:hypothetical protein
MSAQKQTFDWLLIYYMPYDNNLSPLATTILNQFKIDHPNKKIGVTLQTDLAGPGGMTRYAINDLIDSIKMDDEYSGRSQSLDSYLAWVSSKFKARHYCIVLLNHGGTMNQYGLDEYPEENWLTISSVAESIKKFNAQVGISRLDLLFEQVCARATLENLYEFRDISHFTLASQTLVPAPGYYYTSLVKNLTSQTASTGSELADLIVKNERSDMYYSYSLVDNSKWPGWSRRLNNYIKTIETAGVRIDTEKLKIISYWHDLYWDFAATLNATQSSAPAARESRRLISYTTNELLCKVYVSSTDTRMVGYSGLSIRSPFAPAESGDLAIKNLNSFNSWLEALRRK